MEVQQQQLGKVKLKLEQPAIVCAGRQRVTCYYKGKILESSDGFLYVSFKSYGEEIQVMIDEESKRCLTPNWLDLKMY